jgi:hypothetical protein
MTYENGVSSIAHQHNRTIKTDYILLLEHFVDRGATALS